MRALVVIVVVGLTCLVAPSDSVAAADGNDPGFAEKDRVIAVSPAVVQEAVAAGQSTSFALHVSNTTSRRFRFAVSFRDLEAHPDSTHDKRLTAAGSSERGAGKWLNASPDTFELGALDSRDVRVLAKAPAGEAPGGHFAAVVVSATSVEPNAGVQITTQITTLVLLTVDGAIRHGIDVRVTAAHRIDPGEPVEWKITARNTGNVHEIVSLAFDAHGVFSTSETIRFASAVVFPGARREFAVRQHVRNAPDLFRPIVRWQTLGEDGVPRSKDDRTGTVDAPNVILLPWWVVLLLASAVITLVVRIRIRNSRRREDPEWEAPHEFDGNHE